MTFTSIEIIALVVIIVATVKMLILLVNPGVWMNFAKSFYKKPALAQLVGLILAAVVLYYLIGAGMTIVEILAVTAFVMALLLIGLAPYVGDFIKKIEGAIKRGRIWEESWLYTLVWIVLLAWALKELFM